MENDGQTGGKMMPAGSRGAAVLARWGAAWSGLPVYLRSILLGLLMGLSFPPFDLPVLQIPAWMGMLALIDPAKGGRGVIRSLYPAMLTWNLVATYWLMMATFAGGLAANLANAFVMTVPFLGIRALLRRRWGVMATALSVAAVWTGFEFFHHRWDLSWPWLTLGNAWAVWPALIQWIEWTGHLGISFWVVLVSTLAWSATYRRSDAEARGMSDRHGWTVFPGRVFPGRVFPAWPSQQLGRTYPAWRIAAALLIALPASSLAILTLQDGSERGTGRELTVTVIQPDQNSLLPNGGHGSLDALLTDLIRQTDEAVTPDTDLILWPENALDGAVTLRSDVVMRLQEAVDRWDASLITGAVFVETYPQGLEPPLSRGLDGRQKFNIYNSAIHLDPSGEGSERAILHPDAPSERVYRKANLVPIVERFPFVDVLSRLPLLDRIGWVDLMGYGKGYDANAFESREGWTIPTLICYDSVYPEWIRRFPLGSAGVLVVITNDGWWGDTSGHTQHFEFARLRAIEFGRAVVRSANNGISGIILPDGSVDHLTDYATSTGFSKTVEASEGRTFYARHGSWIGWSSLAVTLAALGLALFDRFGTRERVKGRHRR